MGTLFIVATPIGNLKDITFRGVETLKSVDYILCEDTRVTGKLLSNYQIEGQMVALNEFNEVGKIAQTITDLAGGKNVALVSDAGTPLISDPGYKLVRDTIANGIRIESIPGPSAAIVALTLSGLPPDKFLFIGYLPKKDGKRKELLESIKKNLELVKSTVIFYESPYRAVTTLSDIKNVFGDIEIVICRELTKIHEETRRGKVSESLNYFSKTAPKGEFVVMF